MLTCPPYPAITWTPPWRTIARVARNTVLLLVAFLVLGNAAIASAWQVQSRSAAAAPAAIDGIDNLHAVDDRVWRGAAPSKAAYADLADAGVTTIVDLRAEENVRVDVDRLAGLGLEYVHLPIRDGQVPTDAQVERFLDEVRDSDGITFVHCGAGVGRTGAMSAAYLVASGTTDGLEAMRRNLQVGPPSLEQLAFAASLDNGVNRPPAPIVAASRVLDAPRRLWSRYGF